MERDVTELANNPRYLLTYAKLISDTCEQLPKSPYGDEIFALDGVINEWFARDFSQVSD